MRIDCYNCGGSGGGPDPETACGSCRGRGYTNDDRYSPCSVCEEPVEVTGAWYDPVCEGCSCADCGEVLEPGEEQICTACMESDWRKDESGCEDD